LRVAAKHDENDGELVYGMGFDEEREDDLVLDTAGLTILISPRSQPLLETPRSISPRSSPASSSSSFAVAVPHRPPPAAAAVVVVPDGPPKAANDAPPTAARPTAGFAQPGLRRRNACVAKPRLAPLLGEATVCPLCPDNLTPVGYISRP
jgi:hypothetical protein